MKKMEKLLKYLKEKYPPNNDILKDIISFNVKQPKGFTDLKIGDEFIPKHYCISNIWENKKVKIIDVRNFTKLNEMFFNESGYLDPSGIYNGGYKFGYESFIVILVEKYEYEWKIDDLFYINEINKIRRIKDIKENKVLFNDNDNYFCSIDIKDIQVPTPKQLITIIDYFKIIVWQNENGNLEIGFEPFKAHTIIEEINECLVFEKLLKDRKEPIEIISHNQKLKLEKYWKLN
jgi:hypothetical protein